MALADALNAFAEAIKALDARIAALEVRCDCCQKSDCCPAAVEAPAVATVEAPVVADNEALFDLDTFGPDTIQNELWQQFRATSDAGKISVVIFKEATPRNIIVYADEATQPVYRNAGPAEVRIIQAIAGTHIATLQPGESVKTAFVDGTWTPS